MGMGINDAGQNHFAFSIDYLMRICSLASAKQTNDKATFDQNIQLH